MKEKRLTLSIVMLVLLVFPSTLCAQNTYSYSPILDGAFYLIHHKASNKCGIVSRKIDNNWLSDGITYVGYDDFVSDYTIVPAVYDDIFKVSTINHGGGLMNDVAFCGMSGNKYIVYNNDGVKLTGEIGQKAMFLAKVYGTNLQMLGLNRADGQGFDLRILFEQPNCEMFTTITGPFDVSYYEVVPVNDKYYFYIKAKLFGKEEFVKYDVLGNKLSESDFANIAGYYDQLGTSKWNTYSQYNQGTKLTDAGQKVLFEAATVANSSALVEVAKRLYNSKEYRYVTSWAENTAVLAQCGEALYLAGTCCYEGLGVPVSISSARFFYNKAKEAGYGAASKGLEKIENIEKPIVLKGGPQPKIDMDIDDDKLEQMAKDGYLEAIEIYCHQVTFFSFGELIDHYPDQIKDYINDKTSMKLLPLLLAAAPKDANCQFMLACVYGGVESIGGSYDYRYSFRNPSKAKYWIEKFCANPEKDNARKWGYDKELVDQIIKNIRNLSDDR